MQVCISVTRINTLLQIHLSLFYGNQLIVYNAHHIEPADSYLNGRNISKVFVVVQKQEERTHLPPAEAGAPTLVSRSETEAAGAAVRVGGVKEEAAVLAGVTLAAGNMFLPTRQNPEPQRQKRPRGDGKGGDEESPCRDTSRCRGGTRPG